MSLPPLKKSSSPKNLPGKGKPPKRSRTSVIESIGKQFQTTEGTPIDYNRPIETIHEFIDNNKKSHIFTFKTVKDGLRIYHGTIDLTNKIGAMDPTDKNAINTLIISALNPSNSYDSDSDSSDSGFESV